MTSIDNLEHVFYRPTITSRDTKCQQYPYIYGEHILEVLCLLQPVLKDLVRKLCACIMCCKYVRYNRPMESTVCKDTKALGCNDPSAAKALLRVRGWEIPRSQYLTII